LKHELIIVAAENSVEDGLVDDVAVYETCGGEVVDLYAVADVEGVFEEDEDTAGEELVEDAADDEGKAYEDKGDSLLD
jgi:hypothetical protein